ncbi:hypothetical protein GCM10022246_17930 [Pedobacter ginsengiterrae]|uniref:Lipocalin-like domain-containing protein n=1 Tax=Pedobacter ginsengiterrae TaxID=871696 RepID=A0ABP7PHS2_9SPHI
MAGIYNVAEFKVNGKILPYSQVDEVRWNDVVFEKWATLSIRSNRPVLTDEVDYETISADDKGRNYELAGSGGRHYYAYRVDTSKQTLFLENKNSHYQNEKLVLTYIRPDASTIHLSGLNERGDSISAILIRLDKKYPLKLSRRKALKL